MAPVQDRTLDAVAQLAGRIAHDLGNALLPLRAYGELALKKIARGEDATAEVEEMIAAASRASALLGQLVAEHDELEGDPGPAPEPAQASNATVLLVEDDSAVRRAIGRMLTIDGYRVVSAADGEEAIRLAGSRGIDLVLSDVAMPGLNGRETAERIRETHPDVPVVFMSGHTDDAVLRRGVGSSAAAFLQKPFGADELARALAGALAVRR